MIHTILKQALAEDIGDGDITTQSIVATDATLEGKLIAKEDGIIAGLEIAQQIFQLVDATIIFKPLVKDGEFVGNKTVIATFSGRVQPILEAERTLLNFLQRMSGIATLTHTFVTAVKDYPAVILDTRKTAPGLREFDKLAVKLGGGQNHRFGLFDMVLIKENHIAAAGSITEAVKRVLAHDHHQHPIEIEVENLAELEEALGLEIDRILLDNMSLEDMKKAVELAKGTMPLEASGNVTLDNVRDVAATGVNFISIGALTHSVKAMDLSLLLERT